MDKKNFVKAYKLKKNKSGRCWEGYKPAKGKAPYSEGSCVKKSDTATYDFANTQTTVNAQVQQAAEQTASPELIQYLTASINAEISKIRLAKGTLTVSKKDDGLYCGFFQNNDGQVVHQFENMTIPILAKNLEIKELYEAPPVAKHEDAQEDAEMIEDAIEQHEAVYHRGQKPGEPVASEGYVRIKYGDFELEIKKSMSDFIKSYKNEQPTRADIQKALSSWRRNSGVAKSFRTDLEAAQALLADWATHGEDFNQVLYALKKKYEK